MNKVILVDHNDCDIGVADKIQAHIEGQLHRAFSLIIFNSHGEFLLQRRFSGKYHSPNLLSNACCSHPMPGENIENAVSRRAFEELGIRLENFKKIGCRTYNVNVGGGMIEYEFNHLFVSLYDGPFRPNPTEISELQWRSLNKIELDMQANPSTYTSWFICFCQDRSLLEILHKISREFCDGQFL